MKKYFATAATLALLTTMTVAPARAGSMECTSHPEENGDTTTTCESLPPPRSPDWYYTPKDFEPHMREPIAEERADPLPEHSAQAFIACVNKSADYEVTHMNPSADIAAMFRYITNQCVRAAVAKYGWSDAWIAQARWREAIWQRTPQR